MTGRSKATVTSPKSRDAAIARAKSDAFLSARSELYGRMVAEIEVEFAKEWSEESDATIAAITARFEALIAAL